MLFSTAKLDLLLSLVASASVFQGRQRPLAGPAARSAPFDPAAVWVAVARVRGGRSRYLQRAATCRCLFAECAHSSLACLGRSWAPSNGYLALTRSGLCKAVGVSRRSRRGGADCLRVELMATLVWVLSPYNIYVICA